MTKVSRTPEAAAARMEVFLFCLLVSVLVPAQAQPPTVHYPTSTPFSSPEVPKTTSFDSSLQTGSDDIPITAPPFAQGDTSFPEQIHLQYYSPSSVVVSWVTNEALYVEGPLPPRTDEPPPSVVMYGTRQMLNKMATGEAVTYSQVYRGNPAFNYSSGYIHHVKLSGLQPATTYHYVVGDGGSHMSRAKSFTTLRPVRSNFTSYRITLFADIGATANSSVTLQHSIDSKPDLVISIGDYVYADNYCSNGTIGGCSGQTFQKRWDGFFRFMQPLLSKVPWLNIAGNHEIEKQADGTQFASYLARNRFPGQDPAATTVASGTSLYYSVNVPGAHLVFLNPYVPYNTTSPQYNWLLLDLANFDRTLTPWLFVFFHPPIYNTYAAHYKEVECFRQTYEDILYNYGADVIFHGHVHAYERTNRVYNYNLDACAPAYVTIGDGGNVERLYKNFVDQPGQCPQMPTRNCPSYQNGSYCTSSQPDWSAYREPSFGHATLDMVDANTVNFAWHRNQDSEAVTADTVTYKRPDGSQCANHALRVGRTCDASSSQPNQCFNADGSYFVCCAGSCPTSPGPDPYCSGGLPTPFTPYTRVSSTPGPA